MHDEQDPAAGETVPMPDRRQHRRARVLWGATLNAEGLAGEMTCTVLDISAGGAKLMVNATVMGRDPDLLSMVSPETRVTLGVRASGVVPAEVVWQSGDRVGVRFLIAPEAVRAQFPGVVPED